MHGTFFPSSDEETADNFPQETEHVCGRVRTSCYDVTTHLIQCLILPGIQKIVYLQVFPEPVSYFHYYLVPKVI